MRRARGNLYVNLAIALVVVGAVVAVLSGVYHAGAGAGRAEVQVKWDEANRKAEAAARSQRQEAAALVAIHETAAAAARDQANDSERRWREVQRANEKQGVRLASCGGSVVSTVRERPVPGVGVPLHGSGPSAGSAEAPVPSSEDDGNLRFTWSFVGLWDGAWTGGGGKPLFGDPEELARAPAGSAAAPSPYGPDELLELHRTNASRYDACRRDLTRLNDVLDQLEEKWNTRFAPK